MIPFIHISLVIQGVSESTFRKFPSVQAVAQAQLRLASVPRFIITVRT